MSEKIVIVNDKDEPIGVKERSEVALEDIYRVSALWIENSRGDCLLARRAYTKRYDPGKWGPAVAGTVAEGETYEANVRKEAEEELELREIKVEPLKKIRYTLMHNFFCQWFFLKMDAPLEAFKFDPVEVAEIKWFPRAELSKYFHEHPEEFSESARLVWPELFGI